MGLLLLLLIGCSAPTSPIDHPPLAAPHQEAACSGCHDQTFEGPVATACEECHVAPEHHLGGACDDCHQDRWDDLEHEVPLPHMDEIGDCVACHTQSTASSVDCLECHTHRAEAVNPPHMELGIPGYNFKTDACLRCHPDGLVH